MASMRRVGDPKALLYLFPSGRRGKRKMQGQNWKDCGVLIKAKADVKNLRIISFVIRLTIGFSKLAAYETSCEAVHPPPEKILLTGQRRGTLAFIEARLGALF
jgi:hypothetical protein